MLPLVAFHMGDQYNRISNSTISEHMLRCPRNGPRAFLEMNGADVGCLID